MLAGISLFFVGTAFQAQINGLRAFSGIHWSLALSALALLMHLSASGIRCAEKY